MVLKPLSDSLPPPFDLLIPRSSYYGPKGVRILPSVDGKGGGDAMYARMFFCKSVKQVIRPWP